MHLQPAEEPIPQAFEQTLSGTTEEDITRALASIHAHYGSIDTFIYCAPSEAEEAAFELEQTVFLFAKHLSPYLRQNAQGGRTQFVTLTHLDGQLGLSGPAQSPADHGAVTGLVKTLAQEWRSVFCRALDFDPALAIEQQVTFLLEELRDPDRRLTEVGRTAEKRSTIDIIETSTGGTPA
ncbi:MAG: hypothetical protein JW750_07775 [Anaerolineaceae bacterium]|nr:hypothetical protein [Anaerolineaceae bacterium]